MFDRPYSSSFLEINALRGPWDRFKESQAPPDLMIEFNVPYNIKFKITLCVILSSLSPIFFMGRTLKQFSFEFRNEWEIITAPAVGLQGGRSLKVIDIEQFTR